MTSQTYIHARIDHELKQQAVAILKSQGWNMADFLRYAVKTVVDEKQVPFKREVPTLSQTETALFAGLERSAQEMTIDNLMAKLGIDEK